MRSWENGILGSCIRQQWLLKCTISVSVMPEYILSSYACSLVEGERPVCVHYETEEPLDSWRVVLSKVLIYILDSIAM